MRLAQPAAAILGLIASVAMQVAGRPQEQPTLPVPGGVLLPAGTDSRWQSRADEPGWLDQLNLHREIAGLAPVTERAAWSAGALLHARYCANHGILVHPEDPGSPWYTPEGHAAGISSNISGSYNANAPDSYAFESWLQAPFHAIGMLDPALREVGYAAYRDAGTALRMVAALDVIRGRTSYTGSYPLMWPGDRTTITPPNAFLCPPRTACHWGEVPSPLTSCDGYSLPSGLPVLLQLGRGSVTPRVSASSFLRDGVPLEHCVFDETNFRHPDPAWQSSGRSILNSRDAIVLVPRHPLPLYSTYSVRVVSSGVAYEWEFAIGDTAGAMPAMSVDRSSVPFSATRSGMRVTLPASQAVQLSQVGAGTVTWAATAIQPWLRIDPSSGQGPSPLTLRVVDAPGLPTAGTANGTVTLTFSGARTSSLTIAVSVSITSVPSPAFGQIDTPAAGAVISGTIAVTGWALDDAGVAAVRLYRNCLPADAVGACQVILGRSVVFIGDAVFLAGARPDVAKAFPDLPDSHRAGWGYLMLTPMLPHVTAQQPYGGQGPLTLYVFATDVENNVTLLGRSQLDHTPTSITMANDSIAKPFGAIDTPGQGETVSGLVHNFGWALTPDSDAVAGNSDILIPTSGSTMFVFIDGAPVAPIAYNQCRGSVGNPVPAGVHCNDDVANIFGRTTPQGALTTRTSNPTRHRNLDAGHGAIGVYSIDTTKLTNGLHTIAWSVTDSGGRTEGIGSRFFNVLNSSSDAAAAAQEIQQRTPVVHGRIAPPSGPGDPAIVAYRTGFDLTAPIEPLDRTDGVYRLAIPQLGRVEVAVPGADGAFLLVNGELRDLPAGASFRGSRLAWVPPAGYLGTYELAFIVRGQRLIVRITVAAN